VSALSGVGTLAELDLTALAGAIADGEVSSVEVVRYAADRAARLQPKLNCFIAPDFDRALDAAKEADARRARKLPLGPLHGVPLAHKDMYARAGRISTGGSRIRASYEPDHTATVLGRLDAAGAIDLGTLNMAEFAVYPTGQNNHYGDCRNPWDTGRIPGGSSSGSGAAVSARLCWGSLGSDSGGSTRIPASFCGVSGLKPTFGRISRHGMLPVSHSLDHVGPLASSVRDLARLLRVTAGSDPLDRAASTMRVADYSGGLEMGVKGLRVGVLRNYFFDGILDDSARALDDALDLFRGMGATIVDAEIAEPELCATYAYLVLFAEWAGVHLPWLQTRAAEYGPSARMRLLRGLAIPAPLYHEALAQRGRLLRQVLAGAFADADVLFLPTTVVVPPTREEADETDTGSETLLGAIARNTRPFNYLGLPALSVPCGFDRLGLPVGMQLVGKPFGEARLLRVGHAFQEATDWHRRIPLSASR
jgi:aspartyl-tRNA(Asn)/glutamyl-tRNA(Gln) amidotransferase subunit A